MHKGSHKYHPLELGRCYSASNFLSDDVLNFSYFNFLVQNVPVGAKLESFTVTISTLPSWSLINSKSTSNPPLDRGYLDFHNVLRVQALTWYVEHVHGCQSSRLRVSGRPKRRIWSGDRFVEKFIIQLCIHSLMFAILFRSWIFLRIHHAMLDLSSNSIY
jgi:hypothetical protein